MLGRNSTVNRVANSSESPYRSSPENQVVSQPHHNFAATSAFYSNRESSSPTPSTITPSAPSSVASHTPPHSSASPSSHDVPAYIRSVPQQFHHSQAPYLQSPEPQFSTMNPPNPRYHPAESQASHTAPQPISGTSNVPPPSSPQLHPTHPSTRSLNSIESSSPSRIKVRSLSHIQSFASEEFLNQAQQSRKTVGGRPAESPRQYEISSMPVADIIEMVAGLLTKITTTNDMQHEHIHRHIPPPDGTANLSAQASSVLAFHGKNVPSITILNYLARIHKYCPTTYEVFLSLLVYFDRMTEMVNNRPVHHRRSQLDSTPLRSQPSPAVSYGHSRSSYPSLATPPSSSDITAQDLKSQGNPAPSSLQLDEENEDGFANFFVVDSFNIHRLVIAGVTCASKFFSDVFYTNSRYAKVGGLPLVELNHLELQFLLLNEFRLAVPVEELEAYGTMLVEFYAREVISQQQQQQLALQSRIPHAIEHPRHEPERRHERRDGSSPRRT